MNVRPWNSWVNSPVMNVTQNRFQRGMSMPGSKLRSQFTDISEGFQTFMNEITFLGQLSLQCIALAHGHTTLVTDLVECATAYPR